MIEIELVRSKSYRFKGIGYVLGKKYSVTEKLAKHLCHRKDSGGVNYFRVVVSEGQAPTVIAPESTPKKVTKTAAALALETPAKEEITPDSETTAIETSDTAPEGTDEAGEDVADPESGDGLDDGPVDPEAVEVAEPAAETMEDAADPTEEEEAETDSNEAGITQGVILTQEYLAKDIVEEIAKRENLDGMSIEGETRKTVVDAWNAKLAELSK